MLPLFFLFLNQLYVLQLYFILKLVLIHLKTISFTNIFVGSERNVSKLTLDGVDVMGERLAEEVSVHIFGFYSNSNLQL